MLKVSTQVQCVCGRGRGVGQKHEQRPWGRRACYFQALRGKWGGKSEQSVRCWTSGFLSYLKLKHLTLGPRSFWPIVTCLTSFSSTLPMPSLLETLCLYVPQTHQTPACLRTFALAIPLPELGKNLDMYMLRGPLHSGRQTSGVVQVWF